MIQIAKASFLCLFLMSYASSAFGFHWIQPAKVQQVGSKAYISTIQNCGSKFVGFSVEGIEASKDSYRVGAIFSASRAFCTTIPKKFTMALDHVQLHGKWVPTETQILKNYRLKPNKIKSVAKGKNGRLAIHYGACRKNHKLIFATEKKNLRLAIMEWRPKSGKTCHLKMQKNVLPISTNRKIVRFFKKNKKSSKVEYKTVKIFNIKEYKDAVSVDYARSCNMRPMGLSFGKNKQTLGLVVAVDPAVKCLVTKKRVATYMFNKKLLLKGSLKKSRAHKKTKLIALPVNSDLMQCSKIKTLSPIWEDHNLITGYLVEAKSSQVCRKQLEKKSNPVETVLYI